MRVASLHVYPVKGFGVVDVEAADVEREGLAGDRRAMVVDADDTFLTQRECPQMATVAARWEGETLTLTPRGRAEITARANGARRTVRVWNDTVEAAGVDPAADEALSDALGRAVRLVVMDGASHRGVAREWVPNEAPVSFADGFPLLVVWSASLDDLNARMVERGGAALPMRRFRPNVVIAGGEPWGEDAIGALTIGEVTFDLPKPCARCAVTTTDQETGEVCDEEPLRTLTTFRRSRDRRAPGVLFGWNAVPRGTGRLSVGDAVSVAEPRAPWPVG